MKERIYLDNNASTQVHPQVIEAITNYLKSTQGNPSSIHSFGRDARAHLVAARQTIADYLHVRPQQLVFTSGGTEALNMVMRGIFHNPRTGHLITSDVEHAAVYQTAQKIAENENDVTFLQTGEWGAVRPEAVEAAIRPETRLIALMAVNNETGVKTDISSIAAIAQRARIPFLVDAIALLGKEPIEIPEGVTAICFNAQKCHGPQGIGLAFIRPTIKLKPILSGGDQEFQRRAGTENMSGITGFAEAIRLLSKRMPQASSRMAYLRDKLETSLIKKLPGTLVNGSGPRVCNTSNLAFIGVDGETLLQLLDQQGVAVSHGSACASGAIEPSRVLLNMGYPRDRVESSVRFSLGYFTTEEEIDRAIEIIVRVVSQLRS